MVLDVGANVGQFGIELRDLGYRGEIVSFEPLSSAFLELSQVVAADHAWTARQEALGDSDAITAINISANSVSSSLKPMRSEHLNAAPDSAFIGQEIVRFRKLNSIFDEIGAVGKNIFAELNTKEGNVRCLMARVTSLTRSISFTLSVPLSGSTRGTAFWKRILEYMRPREFVPVHVEQGFFDHETGRSYQVDLVFARERHGSR